MPYTLDVCGIFFRRIDYGFARWGGVNSRDSVCMYTKAGLRYELIHSHIQRQSWTGVYDFISVVVVQAC